MTHGDAVLRQVAAGGELVEFSERGSGEALLLVHAGVFTAWFTPLAGDPALRDFRVLEVLRAGYDTNAPAPTRELTLADHARHCATILDSLPVERAHVLAHSSGALIGLQLAADRPDLVQSLVLVEPASAPAFVPPAESGAVREAFAAMSAMAGTDAELPALFDTFMRQVCAEDYREVMLAALGSEGLLRAERDCGFFFRDEIPAVLDWTFDHTTASRITQPVRFVIGGDSPPMVAGVTAHIASLLGESETITVPGTDHLLPLRDPATLAKIAADFATRHALTAHL